MTLQEAQQRTHAVAMIHDIVGAMRAIAAGRIQSAQRALNSARRYEEIVSRAIQAMTVHTQEHSLFRSRTNRTLFVVMTSEQPLCGGFNQGLVALTENRVPELRQETELTLVAVGHRGARQLSAHGFPPDILRSSATTVHGLRDVVKTLAALVDDRIAAGELGTLRVVYNRYQSISEQVPTEEQILPVNLASMKPASPLKHSYDRQLPVPTLLAGLISQYAFIRLYRVAAESFASEQASRLTAMDGATRNSEKMLRSLVDLERRERQGEITRQVLELVASRFAAG